MSNVLNRVTKEFLGSVNTPDYPEKDWIVNPDLTLVAGVPERYWKVEGDAVLPMSKDEIAAVDAAAASSGLDASRASYAALIDKVKAAEPLAPDGASVEDRLRVLELLVLGR